MGKWRLTQLRELKVGAPNLQDVAPRWSLNIDLEPLAALNYADLAWLHIQHTELGLDILFHQVITDALPKLKRRRCLFQTNSPRT